MCHRLYGLSTFELKSLRNELDEDIAYGPVDYGSTHFSNCFLIMIKYSKRVFWHCFRQYKSTKAKLGVHVEVVCLLCHEIAYRCGRM